MKAKLLAASLLVLLSAGTYLAADVPKSPITNAVDATQRAVTLANEAITNRTSHRFTVESGTAVLVGQHWVWRGRMGRGQGDLEVVVTMRIDGQAVNTEVAELVSIPFFRF